MNSNVESRQTFGPFLPTLVITVSLMVFLIWNLVNTVSQRSFGFRLFDQQEAQLARATDMEDKLKALLTDLLALARTDAEARAIVQRYRIVLNEPLPGAPTAGGVSPAPVDAPPDR